jgi:hypothetical protein
MPAMEDFELSAEERSALLDPDSRTYQQARSTEALSVLADWCTGD